VEPDRLRAGRLPEDVVLEDPHAAVAAELRREASRALGEHLRRDDRVGLPRIAELPCSVLGVAARHPVDLVRTDAGLVLADEELQVPLAEEVEPALRYEPFLDDEKAVPGERLDLLRGERLGQERGLVLSGS
jgi:hypothetical protein